jgi:hypothetical protein
MMTNHAAGTGSEDAMMTGIVTRHTSDNRTL